jgi:hypothetical protein
MTLPDLPPELGKLIAAPIGAVTSMLFMKEAWPRRIAMAAVSCPLAWYASPTMSELLHIPEGFSGWLLGAFGVLVVRGIFEVKWAATIEEWLRARLGLPTKESK